MTKPFPLTIPLLNPNEPEALLAALHVTEGQQVEEGDLICTLGTTKSAADVEAERAGYIVGLRFAEGETVRAGEVLCYLSESPAAPKKDRGEAGLGRAEGGGTAPLAAPLPENLRITKPALALARERGLDLGQFPRGPLVTEKMVRAGLASTGSGLPTPASEFDAAAIIIYGGGGHGKSLLDLLRSVNVYRVAGFVDDGLTAGDEIMGVPVLGGAAKLRDLYSQGVRLAVNAVAALAG